MLCGRIESSGARINGCAISLWKDTDTSNGTFAVRNIVEHVCGTFVFMSKWIERVNYLEGGFDCPV